ncbi:hypothetical protein OCK02_03070 (plasmid) [Rhizobium sp. TRM96647]|nr:hypothetical protein [Rhizobium sp. TRM96647]MCV3735173.1 hypothetical protein [Rhizobium sp. TRM96647]
MTGILAILKQDNIVRAGFLCALKAFRRPGGGDDPPRPEEPRRLHREQADSSACTKNDDVFSLFEPGTMGKRQPGREAGNSHRKRVTIAYSLWNIDQPVIGRETFCCHRSEGIADAGEIDAAITDMADALTTGNDRRETRSGDVTARQDKVDRIDRSRAHVDEHLPGCRIGIFKVTEIGAAGL